MEKRAREKRRRGDERRGDRRCGGGGDGKDRRSNQNCRCAARGARMLQKSRPIHLSAGLGLPSVGARHALADARPNEAKFGPELAQIRPIPGKIWPASADFGRNRSKATRIWSRSAQIRPGRAKGGQVRLKVAPKLVVEDRPKLAKEGPKLTGQCWPNSTEIRPR